VVSEEGLGGNPYLGARDSAVIARRLHALFPGARVLLTVRRQPALLRSIYTQYLKEGGRRCARDFLDPPHHPEFPRFDAAAFAFDRLAGLYGGLFGHERVLVLPQELLRTDQTAFLALLARHIGAEGLALIDSGQADPGNISPPPGNARLFRLGNRFLSGPFNETGGAGSALSPARILRSLAYRLPPLSRGEKRRIDEATEALAPSYADSNRRLQRWCPVDLAQFGY
jgi:hypothetical protein